MRRAVATCPRVSPHGDGVDLPTTWTLLAAAVLADEGASVQARLLAEMVRDAAEERSS